MNNISGKQITGILLVAMGMAGQYFHIEYSGWITIIGLFGAIS